MSDPLLNEKRQPNWLVIGLASIAGLALSICLALAGFEIGRASMTSEIASGEETEIQVVEVTREVPIVVEPDHEEDAQTQDDVQPDAENETSEPEVPEPLPTAELEQAPENAKNSSPEDDFAVFYEVWDLVQDRYDGEVPEDEDVIYAAIEGSLEALDDEHTRFIPPDIAQRIREDVDGSVSGIGAFVRETEDGFVEIVAPIEDQPADLAGLLPGDLIVGVDGESIIGVNFDEVILMVRGPAGTDVTLTIIREGVDDELEFTITRARFEVPVVDSQILTEGESTVAYLRLTQFNRNAANEVQQALESLLSEQPEGLVLDLRNNPGGFLDQTIEIADLFLRDGVVLFERGSNGIDQTFQADSGDLAESIPLVVLVNAGSASASEIIAGAVQDNGRGGVIGEITFGKGSVQAVHVLSDGSELRVTIARWFTPNNKNIDQDGVIPDIEVEMPVTVEFASPEDVQLQQAIEYLLSGE